MCRGYYTRAVLAAWDWRDGKLTSRWTFDSDDGTPGNRDYRGQGNHSISVGDVDGDGKDEIIYGSCVIDDDGKGLYSTGLGHGDAMHVSDLDPDRPGLEVFKANGDRAEPGGHSAPRRPHRRADLGRRLDGQRRRRPGLRARHRPAAPGLEMWGTGEGVGGLCNVKGEKISDATPRIVQHGRLVGRRPAARAARRRHASASGTTRTARESRCSPAATSAASSNNGIEGEPVPVRRHPRRLARGDHRPHRATTRSCASSRRRSRPSTASSR